MAPSEHSSKEEEPGLVEEDGTASDLGGTTGGAG